MKATAFPAMSGSPASGSKKRRHWAIPRRSRICGGCEGDGRTGLRHGLSHRAVIVFQRRGEENGHEFGNLRDRVHFVWLDLYLEADHLSAWHMDENQHCDTRAVGRKL